KKLKISKVNRRYLERIKELCHKNGIEIIYLLMPTARVSPVGYQQTSDSFIDDYLSEVSEIFSDSPGFKLWNMSQLDYPDDYYNDTHHLNAKGAENFTGLLKTKIESQEDASSRIAS